LVLDIQGCPGNRSPKPRNRLLLLLLLLLLRLRLLLRLPPDGAACLLLSVSPSS
jgi:hypothetical protein